MRQVLPVTADPVDPNIVYADVPRAAGRPGVRLNMIASVDGATSVNGVSSALGGPADRDVFLAMRAVADAVLVGAATVRAEGYGPAELPAETQDARRRRGQMPVPPIAVVSRTCKLDWHSPFFTTAEVRPVIVTVANAPADCRAQATEVADVVIAGERDVDLHRAIAALDERGARAVLAEGGPSLNAQLAGAGLVDELCLTLSPAIVGADAKRIVSGPALDPAPALELRSVCEDDRYLFLRYRTKQESF